LACQYYSVFQWDSLPVHRNGTGQDHDALYNGPDLDPNGGDTAADHAADQGGAELDHSLLGVAQVKIVDAQRAEEKGEEAGCQLGFLLRESGGSGLLVKGSTALDAVNGIGIGGGAAVGTKVIAGPGRDPAACAYGGIGQDLFPALSAKHKFPLLISRNMDALRRKLP